MTIQAGPTTRSQRAIAGERIAPARERTLAMTDTPDILADG
jgi:hypothetical protein